MSEFRQLLENPLWRPEDLGRPIPDSPHAASTCLPTWRDNVGYEEQDPRVLSRLATGYPRFVFNRLCSELFAQCEQRFAKAGERCHVYPTGGAVERFSKFVRDKAGVTLRVHPIGFGDVHAASFPESVAATAKSYWQHCGEGLSSRQAEAILRGREHEDGGATKATIKQRIAELAGVAADDVYLSPCGMNSIYVVHRALCQMQPGKKSVQFGFPYVDSLKIQEKFGVGCHFYPYSDQSNLEALEQLLERESISGLYTEFPSNPLLASPDLERLAELARRHEFPVIVDETLATYVNADVLPVADVVCTSLTKYFSGVGDVTAGAAILNRASAFYGELKEHFDREDDLLWSGDATVLERNSRDFAARMPRISEHAAALAEMLHEHPRVESTYFPRYQQPELFTKFQRPGAGWGGLISIVLRDAEASTAPVFDALRVCKGPNLGTNFTLACPYTILAHYSELDFARKCGVSPHLIRVSVGLEEPRDLIARFEEALSTR